MQVLISALSILLALVLLYYGAEWLVKGGSGVALRLHVSRLVIGLTLVAFATSAPELIVSLDSAFKGLDGLSLGNVIGSNICNIALILGLSAIVSPILVNRKIFRMDVPLMVVATLLLAGFCHFSGGVGHLGGLVLLALMSFFLWWQFRQAKSGESEVAGEVPVISERPVWQWLLLAVVGLGALVGGGKLFVHGAVELARLMKVSETVIGLTIVAVGTSLPELATSLVAALKGEQDIAIGNVIGSNIFNVLCIIGITATIRPLDAASITLQDLSTLFAVTFILVPMLLTGKKLSRPEGLLLLGMYIAYTAWLVRQCL